MEPNDTCSDGRTTGPRLPGAFDRAFDSERRFVSFSYAVAERERGTGRTDCLEVNGRSGCDVALGMEALLSGRVWNGTRGEAVRLAYHFAEAGGLPDYYNSWSRRDGFTPFDEGQREAARSALAAWAEAGGVRFDEVDDPTGAQIVFGITELAEGAAGFAFYPGAREGGDVWIDRDAAVEITPGGGGYAVLLHEIGHALGLRHPDSHGYGNEGDSGGPGNSTVMSWRPGTRDAVPTEPGTMDIEALRYLYGEVAPAAVAWPVINDLPAEGAYSTPSDPYDLPVDGGWWIADIDWSGDVDYWRFYAREGYIYTLAADDDDVTSEVSPDITVTGGGGSLTDAGYSVAEIRFTTPYDQWVTVSIRDWDFGALDDDQDVGHYRIQVTSEPDPNNPIAEPPDLDDASWSTYSADHGDLVTLVASFDGPVAGHDVQFVVYEFSGGGTYDIWQTTIDATEGRLSATATWTAVHQPDYYGVDDPEYYFDVYVDGAYVGGSGLLFVEDTRPELLYASWSPYFAVDGDVVTLLADFDGSLSGHDVQFIIYEGSGGGVYDTWQTTIDASESGSDAAGQWTAVHQPDYYGYGDPEYYFDVYIDDEYVGTSDLLFVDGGVPELLDASWSPVFAVDGDMVTLLADFDSSLSGHDVQFVIYEYSGGGVYDTWQTTIDVSESGSGAAAQWTAVHQPDYYGYGDPEYYFYVYVDGVYVGESDLSDLLSVSSTFIPPKPGDPRPPPEDGAFSYNQIADYLTDGYWSAVGYGRSRFDVQPGDTLTANLSGLSQAGRYLAEEALDIWSNVTGLQFQEVSGTANLIFDDDEDGAFAQSYHRNGFIYRSDINVSARWLQEYGTGIDGYNFTTYIHEIGHALGLGHAGNYNGQARYGINNHYLNDSRQATVMSYFSQSENTHIDASYALPITPMVADLIAIHDLYGTPTGVRSGDTTYGDNSNVGGYWDNLLSYQDITLTIFDSGGMDTLDLSSVWQDQRIDLRAEIASTDEQFASDVMGLEGNVLIAPGTVIEVASGGTGNDEIIGNAADNTLRGNDGNDTLTGRAGDDELHGGRGEDRAVYSGSISDYDIEYADALGEATTVRDTRANGDGTDEVYGIEYLVFEGDGTELRIYDAGSVVAADVRSFAAAAVREVVRPRIQASDSQAAEPGDDGTFMVSLNSPVSSAVILHFTVSGTATEGVDYTSLGGQISLQAGAQSGEITVTVLDDNEREGAETVEVTLTHATGEGAVDVDVGSGISAVIVISDNEDSPPQVGLIYKVTRLPEDIDTTARILIADIVLRNGDDGPRDLVLMGDDADLFVMSTDQTELYLKEGVTLDSDSNPVLDVTVHMRQDPDVSASLEIIVDFAEEQEPPPPSLTLFVNGTAEDNVVVLGSSLDTRTNGSLGADRYVVLPGQTGRVSIEDRSGNNELLLDDRVEVASAQLLSGTLLIDLVGGVNEEIEVLAATAYSYTVGAQTGLDWSEFLALVANGHTVSGMVPTPGITASAGTLKVFANGNPTADTFAFGYDLEVRSNGGPGDDVYRLTRFQVHDVEITDRSGTNLVHFEEGG